MSAHKLTCKHSHIKAHETTMKTKTVDEYKNGNMKHHSLYQRHTLDRQRK